MCGEWRIDSCYRPAPEGGLDYVCGQEIWKDLFFMCLPDGETQEWLFLPEAWLFLLEGRAGCGKTYLARALAAELAERDYQYICLSGSSLQGGSAEEGMFRIRQLYQELVSGKKLFLLIERPEEIEEKEVWYALTGCLDEIKERDFPVVIAMVTQEADKIRDPLKELFIRCRLELPDSSAIRQYFQMFWGDSLLKNEDFDIEDFFQLMEGWSFAQMERFRMCAEARVRRSGLKKYGSVKELRKAIEDGAFEAGDGGIRETIAAVFRQMEHIVEAEQEQGASARPPVLQSAVLQETVLKQETVGEPAAEQRKEREQEEHDDVLEDLSYLDPANIDWGF